MIFSTPSFASSFRILITISLRAIMSSPSPASVTLLVVAHSKYSNDVVIVMYYNVESNTYDAIGGQERVHSWEMFFFDVGKKEP